MYSAVIAVLGCYACPNPDEIAMGSTEIGGMMAVFVKARQFTKSRR